MGRSITLAAVPTLTPLTPASLVFTAGTAVALDAILQVDDTFFVVFAPDVGGRVLVTPITGVATVVVADVAGDASGVVVPIQHKEFRMLEGRRLPGS